MSAAPRGLSRPHASFIGTVCQGIHHCALHNDQPTSPKAHRRRPPRTHNEKHNNLCPTGTLDYQIITHINHTPNKGAWPTRNKRTNTHTRQPRTDASRPHHPTRQGKDDAPRFIHSTNTNHTPTQREAWPLLASTLQFSNHHHTTSPARRRNDTAHDPRATNHPPPQNGGVAIRGPNSMHRTTTPDPTGRRPNLRSLPHQQGRPPHPTQGGRTGRPTTRTPHRRPAKTP